MSDATGRYEMPAGVRLVGAGATHVGGVREHNEDSFSVTHHVCVVADGMGGHRAGEVASQLVTQLLVDHVAAHEIDIADLPPLVSRLNDAVNRKGIENGTQGMGTTAVGVVVVANGDTPSAVVFNVGDSRCYRLSGNAMDQLTRDHSHVQELVEAGRITADEAITHPLRNVITRSLGCDASVEADFHVLPAEDCRLLLCSDGLSGEVDDARLADILGQHPDPATAAATLVAAALEGRAPDNVTALVVDVGHGRPVDAVLAAADRGVVTEEIDVDEINAP